MVSVLGDGFLLFVFISSQKHADLLHIGLLIIQ